MDLICPDFVLLLGALSSSIQSDLFPSDTTGCNKVDSFLICMGSSAGTCRDRKTLPSVGEARCGRTCSITPSASSLCFAFDLISHKVC